MSKLYKCKTCGEVYQFQPFSCCSTAEFEEMDDPQTEHDKRMAMQSQIDNALKALGQGELLKRVEELECIIAECAEYLHPFEDWTPGVSKLIARCKEVLK